MFILVIIIHSLLLLKGDYIENEWWNHILEVKVDELGWIDQETVLYRNLSLYLTLLKQIILRNCEQISTEEKFPILFELRYIFF